MLQLSQQFPEVFEHSGLSHGQKGKRMEVVLAYARKIIFWTRKRKNSPGYQMRGKPVLPKLRYVCYLMSHHYQWRLLFNDVATHRYRSHRGLAKFSGHQSRSTSNRGRGFFEKLCPGHAVPSRFVPRFRVSWSPVSGGCRKEWWWRNWKVYKDDPARTLQDFGFSQDISSTMWPPRWQMWMQYTVIISQCLDRIRTLIYTFDCPLLCSSTISIKTLSNP